MQHVSAAGGEEPDNRPPGTIESVEQRSANVKAFPRPVDAFAKRLAIRLEERLIDGVALFGTVAKPSFKVLDREEFLREVDAIAFQEITPDILPVIRELQPGADRIAGGERFIIERSIEESQHEPTDGVSASRAVLGHLVPRPVAANFLILYEGIDEMRERLSRQFKAFDGRQQRDEDRMIRMPVVGTIEFRPPPLEEGSTSLTIRRLVAEVVGPSAVGVDRREVIASILWYEPAQHSEVFLVTHRERTTPRPGLDDAHGVAPVRSKPVELADRHT